MVEKPLLPMSRWYWIALLVLLILAAFTFLTGYNFSLPYIDHPDEPAFNLAAQMIIDKGSAQEMSFHAYPPGIIYINFLALKFLHDDSGLPSEVLVYVRFLTAIFAILTLLPLVALSYQVFNELGSLLIGLLWICTPYIVTTLRFAIPNTYLTFFTLTALTLTYYSLVYNRNNFATFANFSIMLAIVFKTQAIFVMPLVLFVPVLRLYWYPDDKSNILKSFLLNALRMAVFMFWLLVFYPTLRANEIPYWVAPTNTISIPSLRVMWENFSKVHQLLIDAPIGIMLLLSYGLLFISKIRRQISVFGIAYIVLVGAMWLFGVSLFGVQSERQFHPLMALLVLLHGGAFVLIAEGLAYFSEKLKEHFTLFEHISPSLAYAIVFILVGLALIPTINANIATLNNLTKPDSRVAFAEYIDSSLAPAPYITTYDNHKTLNPFWGGLPLEHEYRQFAQSDLDAEPIEYWRENGVEYAIVPYANWVDESHYQGYRDEVTVLKTVAPSDLTRGPSMVMLYLHPIQSNISGQLGSIHFVGYDVISPTVKAGENLSFRLYWQADEATNVPYHVFNHLIGDNNTEIIAQVDGSPLFDERRSTDTWTDSDEILQSQVFSLTIPVETPVGDYTLISGFYEPQIFQRLTSDKGDFVTIMTVTVEADE